MILCAGELLADLIGKNKGGAIAYARYAGGAPFNVACAAKKLGARVGFAGRVGDDCIGRWLKEFALSRRFDYTDVQTDPDRNTTLAFVELDKNGERSFSFYRKNTADAFISDPSAAVRFADIVHVGSLCLTSAAGRRMADGLMDTARRLGKRVSFDMNYRPGLFGDPAVFEPYFERADILKMSVEELALFGDPARTAARLSKGRLLAVTLGGEGSEWLYGGARGRAPAIPITPVDTTGAGDAFLGGLLYKLDGAAFTPETLNAAFRFANVCGALTATARGAIDALPDRAAVEKYL